MPFNTTICNAGPATPSAEFLEAYSVISSAKGWKKWPRIISRSVYDRIREDVCNCILAFGLDEAVAEAYMHNIIDFYLENGVLEPGRSLAKWELGIFTIFKRVIDSAISRRVKAIKAAAVRKARNKAAKVAVTDTKDEIRAEHHERNTEESDTHNQPYGSPESNGEKPDRIDSQSILDLPVWDDIVIPHPGNKKIGRNTPCPCGSGKKYKHCCGR